MSSFKKLNVHIDGASRGNPGPASIGVVFQDDKENIVKTIATRIGTTTNNVAEYYALIIALQEAVMMHVQELDVYSDSELLVKQYNGVYKVKEDSLKLLFLQVAHLKKGFSKISVSHVMREQNKLADEQANNALDRDFIL